MKFIVILWTAFLAFTANGETLLGEARNAQGQIVYLEKHEVQKDESGFNKHIRVEYSKPGGEVFARMVSDFSKNKTVPDTIFEDLRFNTKTTLHVKGSTIDFEEFKNGKSVAKKSLTLENSMVASQGFDNFIRANAEKLAASPQKFQFGVLSELDFYTLTGFKKSETADGEVVFGIKAATWLFRLFASELRVAYDAKTLQLRSFAGRSNIPSDAGRSQDVSINYRWEDES